MRNRWMGFCGLVTLVLALTGGCGGHPTDNALITRYFANNDRFEKLREMIQSDDKVYEITRTWQMPAESVDSRRLEEYVRKLRELGLVSVMNTGDEICPVWFPVSGYGLAIGSSHKGYAYCPTSPEIQYQALDYGLEELPDNVAAYRRIEGHWYLYYWWDD